MDNAPIVAVDHGGAPAGVRVPRISVCLPTYNRAHYVGDTISSILNQTVADFELLVVDNGSTDDTARVVQSFTDPRLRYVRHERNIGHYQNMNFALAQARADYVCIVHDDDIYAPEFLAREAALLDRHPRVGMVHCAVRLVDSARRPLGLHRVAAAERIETGLDAFRRFLGGHDVCCSTVMCRREVWLEAGLFERHLMCADWLTWLKVALRADIAYVATPLVELRVHESSMTATMDPMQWYDEFVEVTERAMDHARERDVAVAGSLEELRRISSTRQSRRFLMAALASAAKGADGQAAGYVRVLRRLHGAGAPPVYWWTARVLCSGAARPLIRVVRDIRRSLRRARAGDQSF